MRLKGSLSWPAPCSWWCWTPTPSTIQPSCSRPPWPPLSSTSKCPRQRFGGRLGLESYKRRTEVIQISLSLSLCRSGSAEVGQVQREVPEQAPERPARGSRKTFPVSPCECPSFTLSISPAQETQQCLFLFFILFKKITRKYLNVCPGALVR